MIEILVKNYLDGHLTVPSFFEFETTMPDSFVIIEKTSSTFKNRLKSATIAIQSYANTMYESAVLNEQVKEIMDNMTELDEVSGVSLNADYNFTDVQIKKPRYQAVFDINHY